jgi:hypothetical protein
LSPIPLEAEAQRVASNSKIIKLERQLAEKKDKLEHVQEKKVEYLQQLN